MLYIFSRDVDLLNYMLEDVSQHYSVTKLRFSRNFFIRVGRKILGRYIVYFPFLRCSFFMPNLYRTLRKIKSGDSVLLIGVLLHSEVWAIAKSLPTGCNLNLWYWNPLSREYLGKNIRRNLSFIQSLGYQIYTFDPNDSSKYEIHLYNQFGRMIRVNKNYELKYDFYFLGKHKVRETICNEIERVLNRMGFINLFIHVNSADEMISYAENIENVLHCKCVVDIVQQGQIGLTLRPLEAMFYKKKLITTNVDIQKYDFYQKENIFIWGKDPITDLSSFLASPYKEIDYNIILHYTIDEWIKRFDK